MKRTNQNDLALFVEESSVRLARINDALELLTVSRPIDMAVLHGIFRDTHSLKSAANLLALGPVEQIAHRLEDILDNIRSGVEEPDELLIDILVVGYSRIEQLLKNPHVMPFIDASKEVDAINSRLLARNSSRTR